MGWRVSGGAVCQQVPGAEPEDGGQAGEAGEVGATGAGLPLGDAGACDAELVGDLLERE